WFCPSLSSGSAPPRTCSLRESWQRRRLRARYSSWSPLICSFCWWGHTFLNNSWWSKMKEPKSIPQSKLFFFLAISSLLLLPASVLVIGLYAPTEARLGIVQKIFYFHVSSAFMMYAGFGVAFL